MRLQRARKVCSHLNCSGSFFAATEGFAQRSADCFPVSAAITRSSIASTSAASALVEEFAALALKLRNGSGNFGKAQRNASRSRSQGPPNLSAANFPPRRYLPRRSVASAAFLQIASDDCVNRGHELLAVFYDPPAQVRDFKPGDASVFRSFQAGINSDQHEPRG